LHGNRQFHVSSIDEMGKEGKVFSCPVFLSGLKSGVSNGGVL
jgi:hypothetical protein